MLKVYDLGIAVILILKLMWECLLLLAMIRLKIIGSYFSYLQNVVIAREQKLFNFSKINLITILLLLMLYDLYFIPL